MRTPLDLPEDLLNEAMKAAQVDTKTKAIITPLMDAPNLLLHQIRAKERPSLLTNTFGQLCRD